MPREYWGALEADLLAAGYVLEDYPERLSLRAMSEFFRHAGRGSAIYAVVHGVRAEWGYEAELLARVLEALWDANWQRQGKGNVPRPKPLQRPGQDAPEGVKHFGGAAVSIEEFHRQWNDREVA